MPVALFDLDWDAVYHSGRHLLADACHPLQARFWKYMIGRVPNTIACRVR
jgi:hypothetical protein